MDNIIDLLEVERALVQLFSFLTQWAHIRGHHDVVTLNTLSSVKSQFIEFQLH